jgi:hypothetical protein
MRWIHGTKKPDDQRVADITSGRGDRDQVGDAFLCTTTGGADPSMAAAWPAPAVRIRTCFNT